MKDEYKILIGAVIVILIVLVGVFALSGSNNPQSTATPTVIPVTATPTATPGGNGGTPSANPTVAPTAAPTVVPTPVPSTEPASGVKQTEFGYWITYPPLGPENWSSPKPQPGSTDIVYFNTTSQNVQIPFNQDDRSSRNVYVIVYRVGDLGETTQVTLHLTNSSYMRPNYMGTNPDWDDYGFDPNGLYAWYTPFDSGTAISDDWGDTINGDYYTFSFQPGETQHVFLLHVSPVFSRDQSDSVFEAFVRLTITGVDDGYSIGSSNPFTLNVESQDIVDQ